MNIKTGAKIGTAVVTASLLLSLASVSALNISNNDSHDYSADPNTYIYVPGEETEVKPIKFIENPVTIEMHYDYNGNDYVIDRIVSFEGDMVDYTIYMNAFAGHLSDDEVMIFKDQQDGITNCYICKLSVKEKQM